MAIDCHGDSFRLRLYRPFFFFMCEVGVEMWMCVCVFGGGCLSLLLLSSFLVCLFVFLVCCSFWFVILLPFCFSSFLFVFLVLPIVMELR